MTIDAHQYFWSYQSQRDTWITEDKKTLRRDFLPDHLKSILKENRVEGCVSIQMDQSEKETDFLIKCAQQNSFVKGIVGWTDLESPGVQARLEYYYQFPEVKGFRHDLENESDEFFLSANFNKGVGLLEQYNFTYDVLVTAQQLSLALSLVRKFPNQSFVINHLGKPMISQQQIKTWKQKLQQIAMHENVCCKIAGLVTEADWVHWKVTDFKPFLETTLEAFGAKRMMYGSDWPVNTLASTYEQQLEVVKKFIDPLSPSERKGIMGDNAVRFYHLNS